MTRMMQKLGALKRKIGKRERLEQAPFIQPSDLFSLANPPRWLRRQKKLERNVRQTWIERPFRGVVSKDERRALMRVANARQDAFYGAR